MLPLTLSFPARPYEHNTLQSPSYILRKCDSDISFIG